MIRWGAFDRVFDGQIVFRRLLDAIARPGKVCSIREVVGKLNCPHASLLAVAVTLLDSRCGFYADQDEALTQALREATGAAPCPLDRADFLFVPKGSDMEAARRALLPYAKTGTLAEPHKSAAFLVSLPTLMVGRSVRLSGPGVGAQNCLDLPDGALGWLEARDALEVEYPRGIELFFLTPEGDVMAIPRKVRMEEA